MVATLGDSVCRDHAIASACRDGCLNPLKWMLGEQLQDADIVSRARETTVPCFEMVAQIDEHRR